MGARQDPHELYGGGQMTDAIEPCTHKEHKDYGYMRRCAGCGIVLQPLFQPESMWFHPELFVPNQKRLES